MRYCGGYQSRHGQEGSRVVFDSFDLLSIPVKEILDTVKSFRNSFDMKVAMKSGTIVPNPGVNQEYVFV